MKMARSVWNFNMWETYSNQKQSKKICYAIKNGKMPPSSVKKTDPGMIPTAVQRNTISNWANSVEGK